MANLANVDCTAKGGFLAIVALELLKLSEKHFEGLVLTRKGSSWKM